MSPGSASGRLGAKQRSLWETFGGQIKPSKVASSIKAETSYALRQQNATNSLASVVQVDLACLLLPHPSIIQTHLVAQLLAEAHRHNRLPKHNLPPRLRVSILGLLRTLHFLSMKEQSRVGLVRVCVASQFLLGTTPSLVGG